MSYAVTDCFICSECGQPGGSCTSHDLNGYSHPLCRARRAWNENKDSDGITQELSLNDRKAKASVSYKESTGTGGPSRRSTCSFYGRSHKYPGFSSGQRSSLWEVWPPVGRRNHRLP